MYDKNNIFAKIARGEIPTTPIAENEYALSFNDINPVAETHVLVIPRGQYTNMIDFLCNATPAEQAGFWDVFKRTAAAVGADAGCNILANVGMGPMLYQSVPHFHMHLIAGKKIKDFVDTSDDSKCPCHSTCTSK